MASLIETFFILFEADASKVKKGATEAEQALTKVEQKVKTTDIASQQLNSTFDQVLSHAAGFLTSVFSAGAIIGAIKNSIEYANTLGKLSQQLKINTENLDAWGSAVKASGGNAETFYSSLQNLQKSDYFQVLARRLTGVKGKITDVTQALPPLASLFERIGLKKSEELGKKLGLDEATIMLLQKGRREVDSVIARQRELGVTTKQDAEIAVKFNQQWEETAHVFRSLAMVVASWLLPPITKLIEIFQKAANNLRKHTGFIKGALIGVGIAITAYLLPSILALGAPIALILALGAAFAIAYEDVDAFLKGNRSMIGYLVEKYPWVAKLVDFIGQVFKRLPQDLQTGKEGIILIFNSLLNFINGIYETISRVIEKITGAFNSVKSFLGFGSDSEIILKNITEAKQTLNTVDKTPLNSLTSSSVLNSSTANQSNNTAVNIKEINISTQATDADEIGAHVGRSLNTHIRQAQANIDDGVAA